MTMNLSHPRTRNLTLALQFASSLSLSFAFIIAASTRAAPLHSTRSFDKGINTEIELAPSQAHNGSRSFQGQAQIDVVTVLMLLGEATVWKLIWGRFRSNRSHWPQWIFAISPGWTPLAASLFAAMNGSLGPPNLIFDRSSEGTLSTGLTLTNLNSGATHDARNTILQNIWHTWCRGPRKQKQERTDARETLFDVTREVGVVDVNLDSLCIKDPKSVWLHIICLTVQLTTSFVLGLTGHSYETLVILLIALAGQILLLLAITPRPQAWHKITRGHRPSAAILHHEHDSMGALIIRRATLNGRAISLEEYCWDSTSTYSMIDNVKLTAAGVSFLLFVTQIILVGWMSTQSRIYYLVLGGLGLLSNIIEAASQPDWMRTFRAAFTGSPHCAPLKGSLMCTIAILVAGQFPAARDTATHLYPDNARFKESWNDLKRILDGIICAECRKAIRISPSPGNSHVCAQQQAGGDSTCAFVLSLVARTLESKQLRDGVATVSHLLQSVSGGDGSPFIDTGQEPVPGQKRHVWQNADID